ncbi:MAG: hypothetical protein NTV89_18750 [Proteobacteria bacterium]|nr:hypothetical protein [Pseudomonadota bacterium]
MNIIQTRGIHLAAWFYKPHDEHMDQAFAVPFYAFAEKAQG